MAEFAEREKISENRTGIPTQLKERMEQRTGLSFDDVRVHYNSDMPAKLGALAYTQGNQVEIGPGQERHLSHELGHVVQQKLGLVRANAMHPRGVAMNTDEELERQADEIGAGKRIEIAPAGNEGTDIVQRYRIMGDYTFAQAPENEQYSKVMVKNGDPASVYFEESAVEAVQAEGTLSRLGIERTGESLAFDVFQEGKNLIRKFIRFEQGMIPNVGMVTAVGYEDIKPGQSQPLRPKEKKDRASYLINIQRNITDRLLQSAKKLRHDMISSVAKETARQVEKPINELILEYKERKASDIYIAISSLGYDTSLDVFTLRNIAQKIMKNPSVSIDAINEKYRMLDDAIINRPDDEEERFNEIFTSEIIEPVYILPFASLMVNEFLDRVNTMRENEGLLALCNKIDDCANTFFAKYNRLFMEEKPPKALKVIHDLIGKFCEFVKAQLDNILALEIAIEDLEYRHKQVIEEEKASAYIPLLPTGCDTSADGRYHLSGAVPDRAQFSIKNFSAVHWEYHYATPIPLPNSVIGSNDRLFIEDAVGKSSTANELANAHWAAHIYGRREDEIINPQEDIQQGEYKVLDCRFNKLSEKVREQFVKGKKIKPDSYFHMYYIKGSESSKNLCIVVQNNMLKYKLEPEIEPYMEHFMMDLAKTIADEFVLQAVNIKDEDMLKSVRKSSQAFHFAASKKRFAIENIDGKLLAEELMRIK